MTIRILFCLLISFPLAAQSSHVDTLIFATYRYSENNRIKNIEPFAKYFGGVVNHPVKVKSYDSVHELIAALEKKEVDIAFINTFGYLLLREKSSDYTIAAALHLAKGARSTYQSAIVSSESSGIKSLETLSSNPGKFSLLLVNPGSTSGNLIPRLRMAELGMANPEKFFTSVTYTKNHALTLKQVAAGKSDLGAFGSEEYHKALLADKEMAKKVNLLWESDPIPLGPALFSKDLPREISDQLIELLLSLHVKNPSALEAIKSGWTEAIPAEKFQRVNERYYTDIIKNDPAAGMKVIKAFAQ
ncbi:MAG TPA: phosphate/phosphite/phosphonate ABC transporter substrate-binding protein [Chryseosolibacter sp.]